MTLAHNQKTCVPGAQNFPPPPKDAYQFTTMETKRPLHEYFPRCLYYTYHWLSPIIKLIKRQGAIYPRDVYILPRHMRVSEASKQLVDAWNRTVARDAARGKKRMSSLIAICIRAYKNSMLVIFCLIPIYTFLGLVPSIALNNMTTILAEENIKRISLDYLLTTGHQASVVYLMGQLFAKAIPWITLVFVSQITLAFLLNISMLKNFEVNTVTSQALSDLLYRKLLTLSELSRSSSISGSIINFIFTDTGRITDFLAFIPMFTAVPFRLVYSIVILSATINPLTMVGIVGGLMTSPLLVLFIRRQLWFTKHYMCYKDLRIKRATEVLTGIRVIKYFSMEKLQAIRLHSARDRELSHLINIKMNSAYTVIVTSTTGPLMLTLALTTLALTGYLDNATAYSAALVINTLSMIFNQLPQLLAKLFESLISSDRLIAFFNLPNKDGQVFCLKTLEECCAHSKDSGPSMQDHDASVDEDNDDEGGINGGDIILTTVGHPSYSWGTPRHLSLPIILDPLFKQTQDTIKKFRRQLPALNNQLIRALAALDKDPTYSTLFHSKPLAAQSGINTNQSTDGEQETSSLLSNTTDKPPKSCRNAPQDNCLQTAVICAQPVLAQEWNALHKPVTTSCVYLDKWCKDCDIIPFSTIDQISSYKETSYLPLQEDSPLIVVKKIYAHCAVMTFFLTDPRFESHRTSFKVAREILTTKDSFPNVINNLEFKVKRGTLVGIHGRVGSGKSSLLLALLGELANTSLEKQARILCTASMAYCPQLPTIFSGTLKSNILFFRDCDEDRLETVIKICALETDLNSMTHGLDTEIGERGITLSGGQKARIALARAVYSDADILLLDDPLSAVDAHVGSTLWNDCILNYLVREQGKTVIIVSHQIHFFSDCDDIYEMNNGQLIHMTLEEMRNQNLISVSSMLTDVGSLASVAIKSTLQLDIGEAEQPVPQKAVRMIEDEKHAAIGRVQLGVYHAWIKAGGYGIFWIYIILTLTGNGILQYLGLYISHWSSDLYGFSSTGYIVLYVGISMLYILLVFLERIAFIKSSINATRTLHNRMVDAILGTRLFFFETNPLGRILNRLSRDTDQCDSAIPNSIVSLSNDLLYLLVNLFVIMLLSWPTIIFIIPLGVLYTFIFNTFRLIAPQLKRITPILASPILALVQDSLTALPSIRCYESEDHLIELNRLNLTRSYSADWLMRVMNRWLSFRVNVIMGIFASLVSVSVVIIAPIGNSAHYTGLILMNSFTLINRLVMLAFSINSLESSMSSAERVLEYGKLKREEDGLAYPTLSTQNTTPAKFVDVSSLSLRYRKDLDLVLRNVSFSAYRGERIGIVGRTGAGKSSITAAMFRLVEPEPGSSIIVNGVDLLSVPLDNARAQLAIIPQDPFLFSGTIRTCLCFYSQLTAEGVTPRDMPCGVKRIPDEKLWRVLEQVRMREYFEKQPGGLDAKITANGDNLSAGQRQLVCVARALLRDAPVVILDEATAQVDRENDAIIQSTIRTALADRVVIAIAHRINTIIDFDRIIVMDAGEVKEFDTPKALLSNPESFFSRLVAKCEDAEELYQKAYAKSSMD
ncbi:MRP-like ABC transporter [Giardia lamblia P15]|uniref:MRP-like ABC transporter n=1 Tax=Giardia intestinalis (strain P15) TaxID=658858 RepID=E1F1Q7_GIAIA|nr:MRP-like ABC transporter [Giardia lamblia P15]